MFKKSLTELVSQAVAKSSYSKFKKLDYLNEDLYRMLLELDGMAGDVELEDAIYFLLDTYQNLGIAIDYDELNMDSVSVFSTYLLFRKCANI